MAEVVNVEESTVEEYVKELNGVAWYFSEDLLCPQDSDSTITANGKGKEQYAKSQTAIATFGKNLEKDSKHIHELGVAFKEYDELLTGLLERGPRFQVLTAPQD